MFSRASIVTHRIFCSRARSLLTIALALVSFAAAAADTFVFGPQTFRRNSPLPTLVTRTFRVTNPAPKYTLRVINNGVTSADIALNGRVVIDTDDFHQKYNRRDNRPWDLCDLWGSHQQVTDDDTSDVLAQIDRTVPLQKGTNTLLIFLRGRPGTSLTLEIFTAATDATPPVITSSIAPAPNASDWNNANPTVTFACSDAGSGIAACTAPITVSTEGANPGDRRNSDRSGGEHGDDHRAREPRQDRADHSIDHDIGSFVAIGIGTVSDDGLVIRSNAAPEK